MKRITLIILSLALLLSAMPQRVRALRKDEITATAAVLIDADTGQVLYDKNMTQRLYPASTTKIMTGLLVVEHCEPDEIITVSDTAVIRNYNVSHIALDTGEQLTVRDALYATMLSSANDAANALAEHVAGSQQAFAELMNERARQIGATGTHFVNVNGLHDDDHYTTAYDLALISREAFANEQLLAYCSTGLYTMPPTNKQPKPRDQYNQQWMLLDYMWCYSPDVVGGKVGYTREARHTMTTIARKNGRTLICVVLQTGADEKFDDTQLLLDYGFDSFSGHTLANTLPDREVPIRQDGETVGHASVRGTDVTLLLPDGVGADTLRVEYRIPDAFEKGSGYTATMTVRAQGAAVTGLPDILLTVPLDVSAELSVPVSASLQVQQREPRSFWSVLRTVLLRAGGILCVLVGLVLLLRLRRALLVSRRSRRRRQRRKRTS